MFRSKCILWIALLCFIVAQSQAQTAAPRWTEQKANECYAKQGWLRGCNYQPDGTPFSKDEISVIKELTGKAKK